MQPTKQRLTKRGVRRTGQEGQNRGVRIKEKKGALISLVTKIGSKMVRGKDAGVESKMRESVTRRRGTT